MRRQAKLDPIPKLRLQHAGTLHRQAPYVRLERALAQVGGCKCWGFRMNLRWRRPVFSSTLTQTFIEVGCVAGGCGQQWLGGYVRADGRDLLKPDAGGLTGELLSTWDAFGLAGSDHGWGVRPGR